MKIDILNGLIALKVVSEKQNFTAAAKEMGISTSAISQTIKQLEKKLGCILLNRTTRSTSVTELGEYFLSQYKPSLEQLLDTMEQMGNYTGKPMGTLRLNLPSASWTVVIEPILAGFQEKYPEIIVELFFEEDLVDMVKGGFDAGIRPSEMTAADMTAIRVSNPFRFMVAGSPNYLKKKGIPKHPKDLFNHNCIHYKFNSGNIYKKWEFEENGHDFSVETKSNLIVNDSLIIINMALKDMGLIYLTEGMLKNYVEKEELKFVLEDFASRSNGYYLYYPNISQVSPKLRVFIDYIKSHFHNIK
ncbi:MAG: LysR family transcriptional regulator [Cyanobacteriota bacterium]